jgi:hypothetical protein
MVGALFLYCLGIHPLLLRLLLPPRARIKPSISSRENGTTRQNGTRTKDLLRWTCHPIKMLHNIKQKQASSVKVQHWKNLQKSRYSSSSSPQIMMAKTMATRSSMAQKPVWVSEPLEEKQMLVLEASSRTPAVVQTPFAPWPHALLHLDLYSLVVELPALA